MAVSYSSTKRKATPEEVARMNAMLAKEVVRMDTCNKARVSHSVQISAHAGIRTI